MIYNLEILDSKILDGSSELKRAATRDGLGRALIDLGKAMESIVVVCADLEGSMRLNEFKTAYPERLFEVGVAEQNMVSVGTGLALYGKIPFVTSFAAFSPAMNFSQINLASYSEANLKVASSHYGLNVGEDGVSAQMLMDVALMRSIPGITIITPCDEVQAYKATVAAANMKGLVYLRYTRSEYPIITREEIDFKIGEADLLAYGEDITIIATGSMVWSALEAGRELQRLGIDSRVINMHTIKPLDEDIIKKAVSETKAILTVEEHQNIGGLGSAVAEVLAQLPRPAAKLKIMGVDGRYGQSGKPDELMQEYGLTVDDIVREAKLLLP